MKAEHISIASRLEDIPNVGVRVASLLRDAGVMQPHELAGLDPLWLYNKICQLTRRTHDPRLLDRILSAIDFAAGNSPQKLEAFSKMRIQLLEQRELDMSANMSADSFHGPAGSDGASKET